MKKIKRFLFKEPRLPMSYSIVLLAARIVFGAMFLSHGVAKWTTFSEMTENFPDPLGMGATMSFWLVMFAEVVCSIGFILGALFRICLIPMIFTMCVAILVIHANDPLVIKELALMYLTIFVLMFFSGPGCYSIDEILRRAMA